MIGKQSFSKNSCRIAEVPKIPFSCYFVRGNNLSSFFIPGCCCISPAMAALMPPENLRQCDNLSEDVATSILPPRRTQRARSTWQRLFAPPLNFFSWLAQSKIKVGLRAASLRVLEMTWTENWRDEDRLSDKMCFDDKMARRRLVGDGCRARGPSERKEIWEKGER